MLNRILHNRLSAVNLVILVIIGAVCSRMLPYYLPTKDGPLVLGLLIAYIVLYLTRGWITRWVGGNYIHLYITLQMGIASVLIVAVPNETAPTDFFSLLLVTLCVQAMTHLPEKLGSIWVGVLAFMVTLLNIAYNAIVKDNLEGIGFSLTYVSAMVMLAVFISVTRHSEEDRDRTQLLLVELQKAHAKLEEYSRQVEKLATLEERSRMARELHDSVSQTIFSLTMTAQAAKLMLEKKPEKVPEQLDRLQSLSRNALAEMRTLIQQSKQPSELALDLPGMLQRHADERLQQDGLTIHTNLCQGQRLPVDVEGGWFRVAQEALNNVVKHAGVKEAWLTLDLAAEPPSLSIIDHGSGFDPSGIPSGSEHMGLQGMQDRIRELGGKLIIESAPGQGTHVRVEHYSRLDGKVDHDRKP
jgi:signal transduction histidine kinase